LKVPDQGGEGVHYVTENSSDDDVRKVSSTGNATKNIAQAVAVDDGDAGPNTDYHVVKRGENLSLIAAKHRLSLGELLKLNNLNNRSVIRRGQKLRLRPERTTTSSRLKPKFAMNKGKRVAGNMESLAAKAVRSKIGATKAKPTKMATRKHVVRRGETLYDVSKKYGVAINRLAKANEKSVHYRVLAGERLIIPE
jgi:LysM repeat protein